MEDQAREIELKLEVPVEDLPRLQRHPLIRSLTQGRAATRPVRSVYFDTAELDLSRCGLALRVRRVGRSWIQTIKTRGRSTAGLFDRGEIECVVPEERPDLARVPDLGLRAALEREIAGRALEAVIETDVRRTRRLLRIEQTELLFDLDSGEVRTRGGSSPISELELELVRGSPAVLYDLALELQKTIPLRPARLDKAERGYAALTGEVPGPRKAGGISVEPHATLEDLLIAVVGSCLDQIVANEHLASEGTDPEGVHQLRVGVRRLRSALALFGPMLPPDQVTGLREELRWLGRELGDARDLDVFLEETLEPLLRRSAQDPALKRLRDEAGELRTEGYARVRAALASPRATRLVLGLGRWLASRGWREQTLSAEAARLFAPARQQSLPLLDRRHRKARQLGRRAVRGGSEERHRLRVQLKKLRYAAEFLGSAHGAKQADRYVERLTALQDTLGRLNDVASAEQLLERLLERLGPEAAVQHHRAVGFVLGWNASGADRELRRLTRRWKRFEKVAPFWARS